MRTAIFAGLLALSASSSFAQTGTPPATEAPAAETAAPAGQATAEKSGDGGPANLCEELMAFMTAPPPAAETPAKPAADAKSAAEAKDTLEAKGAPASGQAVEPEPPGETGSAQEISGQSGPAHGAPAPNPKLAAQGDVQKAPQTSSMSAPVPTEPSAPAKESIMSVAEVQALAATNDIAACQDAARKLRLAGAAMPPPLIALTALDLRFHQAGTLPKPAGTQQ